MNAIEATGLKKVFRGKKMQRVEALKEVTFSLSKGEVFGFLGPNGAGKSTTIKVLTGQIRASSGEAFLWGQPVSHPSSRQNLGYLPENPSFPDTLTASDYLRFVGKVFSLPQGELQGKITSVLSRLELDTTMKRPIRGFSKGMVQRLGLAQALLADPDLLILDEPMSGLDPLGRALVKDLISELRQKGKTIFFSTHITADVEQVCDRVGIIVGGRLQCVEPVEELLQEGLSGYRIYYRKDGTMCELPAAREDFPREMETLLSQGIEVDRVEPQRRDLETFFLETVERARYEN
ncbi:MAG: ABC transporter ATP-binding protein [Desulfuromonas sp.]|nr:MAG: ABC transporter ATP-binding protein [Desulfuromonas sp.]